MATTGTVASLLHLTALLCLLRVAQASASDKPRIQPLAFPEIVNLGEEVTVTCAAAFGRKPFQFAWTKDGKPMANSVTKYSRVIVDNIAVMTIEKVGAEDVGNYTCTVSNEFGSDSATARLIVDGKMRKRPPLISPNC